MSSITTPQEEVSQRIEGDLQFADIMRWAAGETPLVVKLRAKGSV